MIETRSIQHVVHVMDRRMKREVSSDEVDSSKDTKASRIVSRRLAAAARLCAPHTSMSKERLLLDSNSKRRSSNG